MVLLAQLVARSLFWLIVDIGTMDRLLQGSQNEGKFIPYYDTAPPFCFYDAASD